MLERCLTYKKSSKVQVLTHLQKQLQQGQVWAADVKVLAIIHFHLSYLPYVVTVILCLLLQNVFKVMVYSSVPNEVFPLLLPKLRMCSLFAILQKVQNEDFICNAGFAVF